MLDLRLFPLRIGDTANAFLMQRSKSELCDLNHDHTYLRMSKTGKMLEYVL